MKKLKGDIERGYIQYQNSLYINIETPVLHHLNSFYQQIIFYTQLPYFLLYI